MKFSKVLFYFALVGSTCAQTRSAAALGKQVLEAGLDASECYRVRDLELPIEDAQFYFTEGYLIFGKPVDGAPLFAVFASDVEGGDAEVLLMPPDRSERKMMSGFIDPRIWTSISAAAFSSLPIARRANCWARSGLPESPVRSPMSGR